MNSILAAECGSTTTTAVLLERSGETFYLKAAGQAPSSYAAPWDDITLGVQEAIRHIEKTIGRTLLSPGGWPITPQSATRQGVDAFVIVSSAAPPLQVMLAGLMPNVSLASARRAAASTYSRICGVIALDSPNQGQPNTPEAHIQAIQAVNAEVIFLVGGIDGGASAPVLEMAQIISMALLVSTESKPDILYAGNAQLRPQMADILGPITALKSTDNVRPVLDVENLAAAQQALETLYLQKKMLQLPGYDKLKNWTPYDVTLAGKSFEKLINYLGQHKKLNVLGVNIGSRSTVAVAKSQNTLNTTICTDAGMGHSLATLLNIVPIEKIHRWLPFALSPEELYNKLLNKSLQPAALPSSPEDLMIEHAIAREALRLTLAQDKLPNTPWNLIVAAGRTLTGVPQAGQAALVLLDSLEPWGVTTLVLDRNSVANMLGSIAAIEPLAAVQVAQRDAFLTLGTLIAPTGRGQRGKTALKLKITRNAVVEEREVIFGTITVIPLPAGQKATLEIKPARQLDVGLGQPGRGIEAEVEGGVLGIIVDARGRPLRLLKNDANRQEQIQAWLAALNVNYAAPIQNY